MGAKEEKYKWVDITNELEHVEIHLTGEGKHAVQYRHGVDVLSTLFTLVDQPGLVSRKRFIPGRLFCDGDYRVMIDYIADPEDGIGAVWQRVPCAEWVDVTRECKPIIRESMHTAGHYGMLIHKGQEIALLGIDGIKLCPGMSEKYKIERPKNARVSFSVFRKVTH